MRLKPGILALLACVCAVSAAAQAPPPTFSNEVVRIFQQNCQTCHHPGDIAPFSLMDYPSARPYALSIKAAVQTGEMPPWKPVPGHGQFRDTRRLTPEQIDTIVRWADAGAPEGNPAQLPPPLTFPDGWTLGQPDLVLRMNEFTVPGGSDLYRCFSIPVNLTAGRYVSAIDIRPGNRSVVHHVLAFGDSNGLSAGLDAMQPGEGYTCFGGPGFTPDDDFFAGWAPGMRAMVFDPGTGLRLRANSRVAIQVHYHPRGDGARDATQIGIYFSRTPVDKIVRVLPLVNTTFVLPAGAPRTRVTASFTIPPLSLFNSHIVGIAPHMHLLGREMKVEARSSSEVLTPLIYINDWDFEWQSVYFYRQPIPLPGGSTVSFEAFYDNSADNPRNPNSPPKDVRWGEETTDEMALVFFLYTTDSEHLSPPQATSAGLVNAASFSVGAAAPGTIVSLFGSGFSSAYEAASSLPLPRRLAGGTRVTVGGVEAPLFYVSPAQINFQVPYEVPAGSAEVRIIRAGDNAAQAFQITVGIASPGIFVVNGAAAALNARSGALVTAAAPVPRGEFVSLFASGLGAVSPAVTSGAAPSGVVSTTNTVTVMVGNTRAEVSFAGLAPNFAGLYQVNFRVPSDAPVGDGVPVKIVMAGAESNSAALAVR